MYAQHIQNSQTHSKGGTEKNENKVSFLNITFSMLDFAWSIGFLAHHSSVVGKVVQLCPSGLGLNTVKTQRCWYDSHLHCNSNSNSRTFAPIRTRKSNRSVEDNLVNLVLRNN